MLAHTRARQLAVLSWLAYRAPGPVALETLQEGFDGPRSAFRGTSRATLLRDIRELRRMGAVIVAEDGPRYRLVNYPEIQLAHERWQDIREELLEFEQDGGLQGVVHDQHALL